MINNQFGRSMIEMLGVLAIIGVLSVGGLDMVSKSRRNNQMAELLGGISKLSATIVQYRQYFSEVKSSYGSDYALFLQQAGKLPDNLTLFGTKVTAKINDNNIVVIKAEKLEREMCTKIASNDWGTRRSSKFVGVIVGNSADFSCTVGSTTCVAGTNSAFSGVEGYPMPISKATTACSSATDNTVHLGYKL